MARSGGPPAASCCPLRCSTATIYCLAHDDTAHLLRGVLLRLPSLASLVRAACTCRAVRRLVACDPDFRRRFRATHPAPLLGLFLDPRSPDIAPAVPSFAPARRDDADAAAAILGGDFFLTALQVAPAPLPPAWRVLDARGGHLLLLNWPELTLAVLNPLSRRVEGYFDLDNADILDGDAYEITEARLLCAEEHPSRFRIFCLVHDASRVQVLMFADDNKDGSLLQWIAPPEMHAPVDSTWLHNAMQAGDFIYWFYVNHRFVIILDTKNLRCRVQRVHPSLNLDAFDSYFLDEDEKYIVDEGITRQLLPPLPYIVFRELGGRNRIGIMYGGIGGNFDVTWVATELIRFPWRALPERYDGNLGLVAVRDGFVYFTSFITGEENGYTPAWFGLLRMETKEVEMLFQMTWTEGGNFQPYHMPWPRYLLGDYGAFAGKDDSANA
ncbi:hypothetical protein ACP4OV_027352 [Aristida adscensionis]